MADNMLCTLFPAWEPSAAETAMKSTTIKTRIRSLPQLHGLRDIRVLSLFVPVMVPPNVIPKSIFTTKDSFLFWFAATVNELVLAHVVCVDHSFLAE
jgi:hypothetical protein